MLSELDRIDCQRVIAATLAEDLGQQGDITSAAVISPMARFTGVLQARHAMVVAGLPVAEAAFRSLCSPVFFASVVTDGTRVTAGTVLARIDGPALPLLAAERTALNLLQLLSGIATETRRYVDCLAGTRATLLDTRKTVPGLRRLSKYAVRCGGGQNHRLGLHDAILIKDNHIAICGGVAAAVCQARAHNQNLANSAARIEVECDTLDQVNEALTVGVERLLLDNMSPEMLRAAVELVAGRAETEASGGVRLDTIRAIAESGVDYISVGAITQSAAAVDIGLDWS